MGPPRRAPRRARLPRAARALRRRHGLILIIAIGESLVAIGIGARHTTLDAGAVGTAVLGLVVAISFWLSYFDFFAIRGRQLLAARSGADRTALARDIYTYLHLPMVAGVILFAFAMKVALAHRGDELGTVEAVALCGGPSLYLFSYVALRYRVSRTFGRGRLIAAIACALLIPVARELPAVATLALLAAVWGGLHAYELIWFREARAETRQQGDLRRYELLRWNACESTNGSGRHGSSRPAAGDRGRDRRARARERRAREARAGRQGRRPARDSPRPTRSTSSSPRSPTGAAPPPPRPSSTRRRRSRSPNARRAATSGASRSRSAPTSPSGRPARPPPARCAPPRPAPAGEQEAADDPGHGRSGERGVPLQTLEHELIRAPSPSGSSG